MKINNNRYLIHWWDPIFRRNKVYVKLDADYQHHLLIESQNMAGSFIKLSKKLTLKGVTISDTSLRQHRDGGRIPVKILYELYKFLMDQEEFSKERIEGEITWIGGHTRKGIKNPKLPFNLTTPDVARLYFAYLGDGTAWYNRGSFTIQYSSTDFQNKMLILNAIDNAFGNIDISKRSLNNRLQLTYPSIVSLLLKNIFKIKAGSKNYTNPAIHPYFINEAPLKTLRAGLKQLNNDEGYIRLRRGKIGSFVIGFGKSMHKLPKKVKKEIWDSLRGKKFKYEIFAPKILVGYKNILTRYGIICSNIVPYERYFDKKGNECWNWRFRVTNSRNLKRFAEVAGFDANVRGKYKNNPKEKLGRLMIATSAGNRFPAGTVGERSLNIVKKLSQNHEFITSKLFAKETGYTIDYAGHLLKNLLQEGYIELKKKVANKYYYKLSLEKGIKKTNKSLGI